MNVQFWDLMLRKGENVPVRPSMPMSCEFTGPCRGMHTTGTDA